jgi:hypothetical protein
MAERIERLLHGIPKFEVCVICGKRIPHDDAHFFHDKGCGFEQNGVCYCDNPCCPECCPDCKPKGV